jgi:transcription elongation GreA/GreB family factor
VQEEATPVANSQKIAGTKPLAPRLIKKKTGDAVFGDDPSLKPKPKKKKL